MEDQAGNDLKITHKDIKDSLTVCDTIHSVNLKPKSFLQIFLSAQSNKDAPADMRRDTERLATLRKLWGTPTGWPSTLRILRAIRGLAWKTMPGRDLWREFVLEELCELKEGHSPVFRPWSLGRTRRESGKGYAVPFPASISKIPGQLHSGGSFDYFTCKGKKRQDSGCNADFELELEGNSDGPWIDHIDALSDSSETDDLDLDSTGGKQLNLLNLSKPDDDISEDGSLAEAEGLDRTCRVRRSKWTRARVSSVGFF
ncbi:uncharacterized protein MELLADRAFT_62051 [Melampsora larici-populina 98AG31]|uniref:Uncharacterized protein n=1 Tax=Melampsora larici-populina (strain 98AG31 / pathotype 3-4-7) TaxID=747676 RepID=F4RH20_MELLP|nr:uncharacterized protein MELLADRAFT_62051 [Melampsora larici-populina 98AG31]EGG08226.1 hypothetical protein MELLADRAFT_62051 [Melampsora larici-populina 98AG31]